MKKITIDNLKEGMISGQTICGNRGMILLSKGATLTNSIIQRLEKFDIDTVDIKEENDELTEDCSTNTQTAAKAISAVKDLAAGIVDLRTINVKNNIAEIEHVIQSILKKPFIQEFLADCAEDELLYHHSMRTAILSINVGLAKEYDAVNLECIAMCAILHDCGMGNKFKEQDTEHPFAGFMKLRDNLDIDMVIALACLQHHENYNGGGYPFSFNRTQISDFASVLAVVDYYDRLIMKKKDPRKALFETIGKKNTMFAPDIVELFGATIDWSRLFSNTPSQA